MLFLPAIIDFAGGVIYKIDMSPKLKNLSKRDYSAIIEFANGIRHLLGDNLLKIILFGSKTTGKATKESDIDILVMVTRISPAIKDSVIDTAFDVNLKQEMHGS